MSSSQTHSVACCSTMTLSTIWRAARGIAVWVTAPPAAAMTARTRSRRWRSTQPPRRRTHPGFVDAVTRGLTLRSATAVLRVEGVATNVPGPGKRFARTAAVVVAGTWQGRGVYLGGPDAVEKGL